MVMCSSFKTLGHNEELNQQLKSTATYFFAVCDEFFGNARLQGWEPAKSEGEASDKEIVITCSELRPLITSTFKVMGMDFTPGFINEPDYAWELYLHFMNTCVQIVGLISTKMGYNELSKAFYEPFSGATYPLETGIIDYPSSGKLFHCEAEECVDLLLKVIPFGQGNSMEVVPIIARLILNSCLNGLNKKVKKNNTELTNNKSKPCRIHHEHFDYFIDPIKLRIPAKDVDNFSDVDMTTSDAYNQTTNLGIETGDAHQHTDNFHGNEAVSISSEAIVSTTLQETDNDGSSDDDLVPDGGYHQYSGIDSFFLGSENYFESDEDEPDYSTFGLVMNINTHGFYKELFIESEFFCSSFSPSHIYKPTGKYVKVKVLDFELLQSLFTETCQGRNDREGFFDKHIWQFYDYVEISLRIGCFNETVSASQRINCPWFVDYGECVLQGDRLNSIGYFVCFDHDMDNDNSFEKFDSNDFIMASAAYKQLVQLVELGVDGSRVDSHEFCFKNGSVFLTSLDFLSLFDNCSEKEFILSRLDERFPLLRHIKKACIETNVVHCRSGTEQYFFSDPNRNG
ncbi:unnamed protein product [Ambrosiozyma monospora]|uniref:Unnamed protein product n=1 Tax=Ambrosiozyma monospora TaxID=43982 RepID=A0ACB5T6E6_AMBMO|nr:unnamed protein product [Ambrosiozyma monospora]